MVTTEGVVTVATMADLITMVEVIVTMAMAGGMVALPAGAATACLPEATMVEIPAVSRERSIVPTARRQMAVARDSASNAAPL